MTLWNIAGFWNPEAFLALILQGNQLHDNGLSNKKHLRMEIIGGFLGQDGIPQIRRQFKDTCVQRVIVRDCNFDVRLLLPYCGVPWGCRPRFDLLEVSVDANAHPAQETH
jgi:hypothetical protein